jgi:hypothetical protein
MRLNKINEHNEYISALMNDYRVEGDSDSVAAIYVGSFNQTHVTAFVRPDGTAFIALDDNPEGYVAFSKALAAGDCDYDHDGIAEHEVCAPGTFDHSAPTIYMTTALRLW